MEIISWNINGLKSGFEELRELVRTYIPDVVCLQKVRCNQGREVFCIDGYQALYETTDCGNSSGVMTYAKITSPSDSESIVFPQLIRLQTPELSKDGHLQIFDCKSFFLINAYVPFSNVRLAGAIETRKKWDNMLRRCVVSLSSQKPIIICGDLNVVHTHKDTCEKRLSQNRGCFFDWERDNFNSLLGEADLVDSFRQLHTDVQAVSFYGNYRAMQIGNRIDYFLISRSLLPYLNKSEILTNFGTGQSAPLILSFTHKKVMRDYQP